MSEHSRSHSPYLRGAAVVAALGVLAGCTETNSSVSTAQTVPQGQAVLEGGVHGSPTDGLINDIQAADKIASAISSAKTPSELQIAAKLITPNMLGVTALDGMVDYKKADTIAPIYRSNDEQIQPAKAKKAAREISDPAIKKVYLDSYTSGVVKDVLGGVYLQDYAGGMKASEGKKILKNVSPSLAKKYGKTLDAFQAYSSLYEDPKSILADAKIVSDPALRNDLEKLAVAPYGSAEHWQAQEDILARADKAMKINDKASADYWAVAKVNSDAIEDGAYFDRAIQSAVKKQNGTIVEQPFRPFPELQNPTAKIDLQSVVGPKPYVDTLDDNKVLQQFGEVFAKDGKIQIHFEQGSNITAASEEQLRRLTGDVSPLVSNAFANGDLLSIRFIIGDDFNPYYDPNTRTVFMLLSNKDPLSEEQFRTILTHEVTHDLVDTLFAQQDKAGTPEVKSIKNACDLLADHAYGQYRDSLRIDTDTLDRLIAKSNGDVRKIWRELKELTNSGKLADVVEDDMSDSVVTQRDAEYTNCTDDNFAASMTAIGRHAGLDYDAANEAYDKLLIQFDPAIAESLNASSPSTTAGTESSAASTTSPPEPDADYKKVFNAWDNAINNYSLFKKLNESSYVKTDSFVQPYLGHSRDNSTELMATVADISLNNAEGLKRLMGGLDPDGRKAVNKAIDATYTIIINRHPALKAGLRHWQKQFTEDK